LSLRIPRELALPITHTEVRRHPRWREQVNAEAGPVPVSYGARLVGLVAVLIVLIAVGVLILSR
jgi:hypothetical protein